MKLARLTCALMIAASALAACNAKASNSSYLPTIPVNISGVVVYKDSSVTKGNVTKTTIHKHAFNNKTLIRLLNQSTAATNTMALVTGVSQIPAGSSILFDIYHENLIITNKNGFSFPLYEDSGPAGYYDYGYLEFDEDVLFGSSTLNNSTGAGAERDLTGVLFYFQNAGSGSNYVELEPYYGNGSFDWDFGTVSSGVQAASVKFTASPAGCYAEVGGNEGITTTCNISGSGKATIYSLGEPFYEWW